MTARDRVFRLSAESLESFGSLCLKISDKNNKLLPFEFNRAQRYVDQRLDDQLRRTGKVRALILKGRQQGMCLDPETKVLTADLRWIALKDVTVGMELVATDESPTLGLGRGNGIQKMRTATVEKVWGAKRQAYRISFDDGRSVICSAEHRWYSRKSQPQGAWRSIDGGGNRKSALMPGDFVRSISRPWESPTLDDAWFGGMIDGEGSFDFAKRSGCDLAVSRVDGPVLERMRSHCDARGYKYGVVSDDGPRKTKLGLRPVRAISISNMPDVMRLIGVSRPTRFVGKHFWDGKRPPDGGWRRIVSIEPLDVRALIDIQTSTGTFLAEGLLSHNSTYVGARFYRKTIFQRLCAFIVAHEQKATDNLFTMVKRYQEHNPLAPSIGATNAKALIFDKLDAGYKLATAGSKDVGRSNTVQLMHGSEFGFWANAAAHLAGIGNTIGDIPGTEIVLESTANGVGNKFHELWQAAEAGKGDYIAIFVPWFWQDEYRSPLTPDFRLTPEEGEYARIYGLDDLQMAWRRNKIITYGIGREWLFDQEYPATASLAFRSNTEDPFITPGLVVAAINNTYRDSFGPLVLGVDPADKGPDRTAIVFRRGRMVTRILTYRNRSTMEVAGIVAQLIAEHHPAAVFIDAIGIGAGIADRLREQGHRIHAVHSGTAALDSKVYANKRAELWGRMRDWLQQPPVRMPNDPALISDLSAPSYRYDSSGRLLIEKKDDMRARGIRSPDIADALALTFAEFIAMSPENELAAVQANHSAPTAAGY